MNPDKINKWLEFAKSFAGNDFWSDVFEQQPADPSSLGSPLTRPGPKQAQTGPFPAVDMLTSEEEWIILVDLPGVDKQDLHISLNDEALYVQGEAKPLFPGKAAARTERFTGPFERAIELPARIDGQSANVSATFRHGTLVVRIPVTPAWKKKIDIE
ncbi:Hsp20/alpha crystallin family protein [Cohnella lubricantis]|uniref:Hsp20/alpha crystallin family protein n=1 Tax=Cohnella lubricantis TaxID=2163172 RepID=A0A841TGR7_9BACL|nr:Hsp20/alpha crystallin family protein [Cohnella lubricantis]MBB6678430.1 Hsp20/alpha crystallin family protein [Cohnella lubricantis]MBP2116810.1 HSP20 family protein [Cohnella lubricantis]